MMPMARELLFTNRDEWRAWLERNHAVEKKAWLVTLLPPRRSGAGSHLR
jgi:hypothetical protein